MSRDSLHFYLVVALIVATALLGGSSRPDSTSLLLLRPVVVLLLGGMLLIDGPLDHAIVRVPAIILGLFAATMAIQLIALPPGIWLALPGHGQFSASIGLAGAAAGWRPISLDPDLTLNALVALLPAAAMIVGYARLSATQRQGLLSWLVAIAAVSALLGLVQILGGSSSPAYFYQNTHHGLPVGLFANRNHQAVFLALSLAAVAVWGLRGIGLIPRPVRIALVVGGILLIPPVIILTGSRTGLVTVFGTLLLLPWIFRFNLKRYLGGTRSRIATFAAIILAILVIALFGYMIFSAQAVSITRLLDTNELHDEQRILAAPVLLHMTRDFFPFGLGHGAFEPVFRVYEPDTLLRPTYFNRAHNDVLELAMSGGLPTIVVMLSFAGWYVQRVVTLVRGSERNPLAIWPRMAAVLILILVLASITDYPVRTPLLTVIFTLACLWLEDGYRRRIIPENGAYVAKRSAAR